MRELRVELVRPSRPVMIRRSVSRPFKRLLNMYSSTFPVLAALTPPHVRLSCTDEAVDVVRVKAGIDVLGISINTPFASRGYEIADSYRRAYAELGEEIKVVFGGSHATALPEEALRHGDAVVLGEAEGVWSRLLDDAACGRLATVYPETGSRCYARIDQIPIPDRSVVRGKSLFAVEAVQLSRGCTNDCEFCSVARAGDLRRIPLDVVEADISSTKGRLLALLDDNLFSDSGLDDGYVSSVLSILRRKGKSWFTQMSLRAASDPDLRQEMARSGCRGAFIGLESAETSLVKNDGLSAVDIIEALSASGIHVMVGFVFGFDTDTPDVFRRTLEFTAVARPALASFHVLTPYPGTALYERLKSEGRLLHDGAWDLFDTANVVFAPRQMTADELRRGFAEAVRAFYSPRAILRRNPSLNPLVLLANALYCVGVRAPRCASGERRAASDTRQSTGDPTSGCSRRACLSRQAGARG